MTVSMWVVILIHLQFGEFQNFINVRGYLRRKTSALSIDLRSQSPKIKIRTWVDYKSAIQVLRQLRNQVRSQSLVSTLICLKCLLSICLYMYWSHHIETHRKHREHKKQCKAIINYSRAQFVSSNSQFSGVSLELTSFHAKLKLRRDWTNLKLSMRVELQM